MSQDTISRADRVVPSAPQPEPDTTAVNELRLRRRLMVVDAAGGVLPLVIGAAVVGAPPLALVLATLVLLVAHRALGLYRERVTSQRGAETKRVVASMGAGTAVVGLFVAHTPALVVGAVAAASLVLAREAYRSWLCAQRAGGLYARPVAVVGRSPEVADVLQLLDAHPELGYTVTGVFTDDVDADLPAPILGGLAGAGPAVRLLGVGDVVVAMGGMASGALRDVTRELHLAGVRVRLASGLLGVGHGRLIAQSVAHEAFFDLEPPFSSTSYATIKRGVDLVGSALGLALTAPVLATAALAIRLTDRGPVLYRQTRIGMDGKAFTIFKLRTMTVDADRRVAQVQGANMREGPLLKVIDDPRVTPVGRVLRGCGLDELPQLINVLRGEMSLVGPRPALPDEAAAFDEELGRRHTVRPGLTGLWQAEARDNPSFYAYHHLDLFYVDNRSPLLDAVIVLITAKCMIGRLTGGVFRRTRRALRSARPRPLVAGPEILTQPSGVRAS